MTWEITRDWKMRRTHPNGVGNYEADVIRPDKHATARIEWDSGCCHSNEWTAADLRAMADLLDALDTKKKRGGDL